MNIDILHRPTALENLLAGRIWPAGCRFMHAHACFKVPFSTLFGTDTKYFVLEQEECGSDVEEYSSDEDDKEYWENREVRGHNAGDLKNVINLQQQKILHYL